MNAMSYKTFGLIVGLCGIAACAEPDGPSQPALLLTSRCDINFTIAGWWYPNIYVSRDSAEFGPAALPAGGTHRMLFAEPGAYWLVVRSVAPIETHLLQTELSVPGTYVLINDPARSTACRDAGL
jgi:hypothetical protein